MNTSRRSRRIDRAAVFRRRRAIAVVIAAAVLAGVVGGAVTISAALSARSEEADPAASEPSGTATAANGTPDAPAHALLSDAGPDACAISFSGDGISDGPVLERAGTLYAHLPIPTRAGMVFAGWYDTPDAAAELHAAARVNGARLATCTDRERTLHGAWRTEADAAAEAVRVPILMYHQFTENPEGERHSLRLNYAYVGDFDAHIRYIADSGFYLPTWDELDAFIDGRLTLPTRSVVVTDDDADASWLRLAVPVVEKHGVLTTSFVITKWRHEGTPGRYVLQRSHTDSLHEPGANGKGRMVNEPADVVSADLERSAEILGAKEVVAYPFGHVNDTAKDAMRQAGFTLGRTIEHGYVGRGTEKLALPVIRIDYGTTVQDLKARIG